MKARILEFDSRTPEFVRGASPSGPISAKGGARRAIVSSHPVIALVQVYAERQDSNSMTFFEAQKNALSKPAETLRQELEILPGETLDDLKERFGIDVRKMGADHFSAQCVEPVRPWSMALRIGEKGDAEETAELVLLRVAYIRTFSDLS